jgi:hypothetical protein
MPPPPPPPSPQVKWAIEDDDGATVTTRWWGASVTAAASRGDGVATATLLYDAYESFPAEPATVAFLPGPARTLVTPATEDDPMVWRFEGEEGGEEEEEGADGDGGDAALTARELSTRLSAELAALEADAGVSADAAAAAAAVAAAGSVAGAAAATARFRGFMDRLKTSLAAAEGGVVTEDDVRRAVEAAKEAGG